MKRKAVAPDDNKRTTARMRDVSVKILFFSLTRINGVIKRNDMNKEVIYESRIKH